MRDPYDILGIARGAGFEAIKAAYRRACKAKHPDMGGSHRAFIELQAAYEHILRDLKRGYQQRREEAPGQEHGHPRQGSAEAGAERRSEQTARDIEEELEELRRTAEAAARAHEEALRARREQAWQSGEHRTWARLTWDDFGRFFIGIARSGLKGLSLVFAALIGVGTVLVEANVVSAIVLVGSGTGFLLSHALKSDKGGLMSAGLLLFGLMTIWLPPVRAALFLYPLATISVLLCLALILKFAQQGGRVGLLTGGVLSLYVLGVIVADTERQPRPAPARSPSPEGSSRPPQPARNSTAAVSPAVPSNSAPTEGPLSSPPAAQAPIATAPQLTSAPSRPPSLSSSPPSPQVAPAPPPEPRVLLASEGAMLKFMAGVPYRLKVRSGRATSIYATEGQVAFYVGGNKSGDCTSSLVLRMAPATAPYQEIEASLRACGSDAVMRVREIN